MSTLIGSLTISPDLRRKSIKNGDSSALVLDKIGSPLFRSLLFVDNDFLFVYADCVVIFVASGVALLSIVNRFFVSNSDNKIKVSFVTLS